MSDRNIRLAEAFEGTSEQSPAMMDMDIDVMFHAQRVTRLHLEEPTGGQYENAMKELQGGANPFSMERFKMSLIANVAKVDRSVVLGMKKNQIEEAFAFLDRTLRSGPATGET
jgi:hypothetical protein